MNKIGVANMIAGLNRKNSTASQSVPSQKDTDTVKNPLYCPTPSPKGTLRRSRFGSVKENIHKPRKSILKPGSPIRQPSKAIAGSPVRQPRSPLTPTDSNSPKRAAKAPPASPLTSRLHKAAKRHSRRFQRPPSFNIPSHAAAEGEEEAQAPPSTQSNIERIAAAVANNGTPMRMLQVPSQLPRPGARKAPPAAVADQPPRPAKRAASNSLRNGLPRPPPRKAIAVMSDAAAVQSTSAPALPLTGPAANTRAQTASAEEELTDTLNKIKKRGAMQVDYSVYQLVNLFTGTLPCSRSKRILSCLIEVCPTDQLVRWMIQSISGKGKDTEDKHKAADTLTSLLMMDTRNGAQEEALKALKESLQQQQHLAVLIECMADKDWVMKSYVTGILATLNVSPMTYLNSNDTAASTSDSGSTESVANSMAGVTNQLYRSSSIGTAIVTSASSGAVCSDVVVNAASHLSSYSYDSIPHIVGLLQSKSQEVREVALTTLLCMGPVAGGAAADVADLLSQDKAPRVRILCISALKEIGMPFILEAIDVVEHSAKKDKDDSVRKAATALLESVNMLNEEARIEIREAASMANTASKKVIITEDFVRSAVRSLSRTKTGGITQKEIESFVEAEHIMITKDCPRWKAQLRIVVRRMTDKGALSDRKSVV